MILRLPRRSFDLVLPGHKPLVGVDPVGHVLADLRIGDGLGFNMDLLRLRCGAVSSRCFLNRCLAKGMVLLDLVR